MSPWGRALLGACLAAGVAHLGRRRGSLAADGALGAVVLGSLAAAAGWGWAALLIAYFVAASALTHLGADTKARRTGAVVGKGGPRDLRQVLANGGVFGLMALGTLAWPDARWAAAGAGALAASAADTWATEIGTWVGGIPRHVLTWRALPVGMSGGVTPSGSVALVAGAVVTGATAWCVGWPAAAAAAAAWGGAAGAWADTVCGALLQARRWCPACDATTERTVHPCGATTIPRGGLAWLGNDGVNAAATAVGAGIAAVLAG